MTTALKVSEKEWQQTVIDYAQRRGWRVAHFRTSRTGSGGYATAVQADGAGYPDLSMVRGPRLAFVELKAEKGRLAPAQRAWLDALRQVDGAEVYVWRPSDWDVLRRILRDERGVASRDDTEGSDDPDSCPRSLHAR